MGDRLPLPVADKSVAATRNHDHRAALLSGMYRMRIARNRYACLHRSIRAPTERISEILSIGLGRAMGARCGEGI